MYIYVCTCVYIYMYMCIYIYIYMTCISFHLERSFSIIICCNLEYYMFQNCMCIYIYNRCIHIIYHKSYHIISWHITCVYILNTTSWSLHPKGLCFWFLPQDAIAPTVPNRKGLVQSSLCRPQELSGVSRGGCGSKLWQYGKQCWNMIGIWTTWHTQMFGALVASKEVPSFLAVFVGPGGWRWDVSDP